MTRERTMTMGRVAMTMTRERTMTMGSVGCRRMGDTAKHAMQRTKEDATRQNAWN
jgi:hypothetical protein